MTIAATVQQYLKDQHVLYETLPHAHTPSSIRAAEAAHIPAHQLAKGVVLEDETGYLLAVLPADRWVQLGRLSMRTDRQLGLATEEEISELFADCAPGAIPPLGAAYGLETIIDRELIEEPDVYFEAGDHEALIHMDNADFMRLMERARQERFSTPSH